MAWGAANMAECMPIPQIAPPIAAVIQLPIQEPNPVHDTLWSSQNAADRSLKLDQVDKPSLPPDDRTGDGIQSAGCGDFEWMVIRPLTGPIPLNPMLQAEIFVGTVSQIALAIEYIRGDAATDCEIYWEFTDAAKAEWFRYGIFNTGAASGSVNILHTSLTFDTSIVCVVPITNPGAQWVRFYLDGNTTPGNSLIGFKLQRGWSNSPLVEV